MAFSPSAFLKRLQSADPSVKQHWTVGLSIFAMIIVVFVWLTFFNTLFVTAAPAAQTQGGFSFWDSAKRAGDAAAGSVAKFFTR